MKTTLAWILALAASVSGLVAIGLMVSSGCYYEVCPECTCEDGGTSGDGGDDGGDAACSGPIEEIAPQAIIVDHEAPGNYETLTSGQQLNLTAALVDGWTAPMDCLLPISYHWDVSSGSTADGEASGAISFTNPGYYSITMTASNAVGTPDQTPDVLYASLWNGTTFTDDFERAAIDYDTVGWSYRVVDSLPDLQAAPAWDIVSHDGSNRLHTNWGSEGDGTYCQPGSQALLSRLEAANARISVTQSRATPQPGLPHYTDMILRFNYVRIGVNNPVVRFYRARVQEQDEGTGYCICLDAFKIDGEDQVGTGLNGSNVNACGNPLCDPPAGSTFHVTAEIQGTAGNVTITLEIRMDASQSTPWHSFTFTDSSSPVTEPGRFGVSQCWGETYFDDFRYENLD